MISEILKIFRRVPFELTIPALLLILIMAAIGIYFGARPRVIEVTKPELQLANQERAEEIVKKVAAHIILPQDSLPTVATVTDPAKLKDQPFFANAQSGDKVLIYTDARKMILYRPSLDRIVEVAPLNLEVR